MDPFQVLKFDVFDLILQHLSGEYLDLTQVSTQWNDAIGESSECMSKVCVQLKFGDGETTATDFDGSTLKHGRRYQNLLISKGSAKMNEILSNLRAGKNTWKKVGIYETEFNHLPQFMEALGHFEVAEELFLTNVSMPQALLERDFVIGDSLKVLEISNCSGIPSKLVSRLLMRNETLERLSLDSFAAADIFPQQGADCSKFQLNYFSFDCPAPEPKDEVSLNNFLTTQIASIETLKLKQWNGLSCLTTAFEMPKLSKLSVKLEVSINYDEVNLAKNSSITTFQQDGAIELDHNFMDKILGALPNLKVFLLEGSFDFEGAFLLCPSLFNVYYNKKQTESIVVASFQTLKHRPHLMCFDIDNNLCEETIYEVDEPTRILNYRVESFTSHSAWNSVVKHNDDITIELIVVVTSQGSHRYRYFEPNQISQMF